MDQPTDIVAVRGGIVVRRFALDEVAAVLDALDEAEAAVGAPLVDESERERLEEARDATSPPHGGWNPIGAFRGSVPVGYGAFVVAASGPASAAVASGDAAALTADPARAVLGAVLTGLRTVAITEGLRALDVWVRQGGDREVDVATVEGFEVERRLGVLGRTLDDLPSPIEPIGHRIRAFVPGQDDDGVVAVLAAAYEGTPEAGWDLARFQQRQGWSWFRPEDLLLAVDDDGEVAGLHWLKRRDASTGEVYNLAVHPRAQGARLGPALLAAGLHHLADLGCTQVVLWVDRANERAVALYESQGFTTRWDDLAFRAVLD